MLCVDQWLSGYRTWNLNSVTPSCVTIPFGGNLGQVVYSHCLRSFSAPRNWGTKREFWHL